MGSDTNFTLAIEQAQDHLPPPGLRMFWRRPPVFLDGLSSFRAGPLPTLGGKSIKCFLLLSYF